jgi:hypothetical protein
MYVLNSGYLSSKITIMSSSERIEDRKTPPLFISPEDERSILIWTIHDRQYAKKTVGRPIQTVDEALRMWVNRFRQDGRYPYPPLYPQTRFYKVT